MSRNLSRSVLLGGIGVLFLVLAGCTGNPPPEDDVWTLIDRGEGLRARNGFIPKFDVTARDRLGRTPLHAAVEAEDFILAKFLIETGAEVDAQDNRKRTPLAISTERYNADITGLLVGKGADIFYEFRFRNSDTLVTPVMLALDAQGAMKAIKDEYDKKAQEVDKAEGMLKGVPKDPQQKRAYLRRLSPYERIEIETLENWLKDRDLKKAYREECEELLGNQEEKRKALLDTLLNAGSFQKNWDLLNMAIKNEVNRNDEIIYTRGIIDTEESRVVGNVKVIVKNILSKDTLRKKEGEEALKLALERAWSRDHAEIAEFLLDPSRIDGLGPDSITKGVRIIEWDQRGPLYHFYDYFASATLEKNYDRHAPSGDSLLHYLARMDKQNEEDQSDDYSGYIEYILENGANVNIKDAAGAVPLHIAAREGNIETMGQLIGGGADVDPQDAKGNTPLHIAASRNPLQVLNTLLNAGANPNLRDEHGETPLHIVVFLNKNDAAVMINALLEKSADVSIRNIDGKTPLFLAVEKERVNLLPPLVEAGSDVFAADKENSENTPLGIALGLWNKNPAILRALITEKTASHADSLGNTALHIAVKQYSRHFNLDVLRYIHEEKGASLDARNKEGDTSLHIAVRGNLLEAGVFLISHGANIFALNASRDPRKPNETESPFRLAFYDSNNERRLRPRDWVYTDDRIKKITLTVQEDRQGNGNTALHYAAFWKLDSSIIPELIRNGADVNKGNYSGETPLFFAARADSPINIGSLRSAGADRDWRDRLNYTALHAAILNNAPNAVNALLDWGLSPNTLARNGRAPLHDALGNEPLENLLLNRVTNKADIEIRDNEGNTSLMLAVMMDSYSTVEWLLNRSPRADPFTSNIRGKTPLHIAVDHRNDSLVELLLTNGASIHINDKDGQSPFSIALRMVNLQDSQKFVRRLLTRDWISTADDRGYSPLHIAIENRAPHATLKLIMDQGVRLTARDNRGNTVLHLAFQPEIKDDAELISLLLDRIDPAETRNYIETRNYAGETPEDIGRRLGGHEEALHRLRSYMSLSSAN